jgi:dienelactone hydrolase
MNYTINKMHLPGIAILLLTLSVSSPAQEILADGTIVGSRPYDFPAYADAYGYTRLNGSQDSIEKYWTKSEYENAVADDEFQFEKLLYTSDGLTVVAYVLKPKMANTAMPTVVFNRGSGWHKDIAPVLMPYMHRLAQQGFVVIAPMYRQTDGGEGIDANGGEDLNDLMNIYPVIQSLPYADETNIYMTGESRGATMVYQAIRDDFPMRAAAIWGGYTDLQPLAEAQPMLMEYAKQSWPGFGDDTQAGVERRSAVYWADSFDVPVLLMHGESDGSIPVSHTMNLAAKLQESGKLYGMIVYAEDGHILARSQLERDRASVAWFRRFSTEAEETRNKHLHTAATEEEINDRGYSLLRRGRLTESVQTFRINADRFPESSNAYDSLGEALAQSGDLDASIESYQRALALADDDSEKSRLREILQNLASRL